MGRVKEDVIFRPAGVEDGSCCIRYGYVWEAKVMGEQRGFSRWLGVFGVVLFGLFVVVGCEASSSTASSSSVGVVIVFGSEVERGADDGDRQDDDVHTACSV